MQCRILGIALATLVLAGCADQSPTTPSINPRYGITDSATGRCDEDTVVVFRPECVQGFVYVEGADHSAALRTAINGAQAFKSANMQKTVWVLLKNDRVYRYRGTLNANFVGGSGIKVKNESEQRDRSTLQAIDTTGQLFIRAGDVFYGFTLLGPYAAWTPDSLVWRGPCVCQLSNGIFMGASGIIGVGDRWRIYNMRIEGFSNHGVHAPGVVGAKIDFSIIKENGHDGAAFTPSHVNGIMRLSTHDTVNSNNIIYNGANGVDINGDYVQVTNNELSYNGHQHRSDHADRSGVMIWSVPAQTIGNHAYPGATANYNKIEGNWMFQNKAHGVYVGANEGVSLPIDGNMILRNHMQWNGMAGIKLHARVADNRWTRVEGNTTFSNGIGHYPQQDWQIEATELYLYGELGNTVRYARIQDNQLRRSDQYPCARLRGSYDVAFWSGNTCNYVSYPQPGPTF